MARRLFVHACLLAVAFELFCHPTNLYLHSIAPWRGAVGTLVFTLLALSLVADLGRAFQVATAALRFVPAVLVAVSLIEARDWAVPPMLWWTVVAAITLLFVALGFSKSVRLTVAVSAFAALMLRALQIAASPNLDKYGDMFPLVDGAISRLGHGESPYFGYTLSTGYVPLTYLPVTWLAYLPFRALGLDLRWGNALAHLATLGAVLVHARRAGATAERTHSLVRLATWPLLSAATIAWDLGATAAILWAVLAWTLGSVLSDQRRAPIWLGLSLATSPLALPFAMLIAASWWRALGVRAAARRLGVAVGIAFAICAPFLLWSPRLFIEGVVLWFSVLFPPMWWKAVQRWQPVPGVATWFWRGGIEWMLKPLQLGAFAAFAAFVARGPKERLALVLGVSFLVFMLLNPVLWTYFYEPAFIATLIAATCIADDQR